MKNINKQIIYIFLIFSVIISFSHIIVEDLYSTTSSKEIILDNAKKLSIKREKLFRNFLEDSKNIIMSTRNSKSFNDFLLTKSNKSSVEDLFLTFASANNNFMQFRYLDEHGEEIIKVGRKKELTTAFVTPENLLQNKKNRYYFHESKYAEKNKVWFSSLELNIENDKVQMPFNPTIRAILPIFVNNKFKGVIVINYFAEDLIEKLINSLLFKITLVDDLGYIIASSEERKSWGFYKDDKFNISMEYKKDFNEILSNDIYFSDNLFSKSLNLELFEKIFIIFEVNENLLEEQKSTEFIQEVFLSLIYLFISLILSFIMIKIFSKLFIDLNEQKETVYRLDLASNVANIAIWELDAKTRDIIWSENIKSILKTNKNLSYYDFLKLVPLKEKDIFNAEFVNSIKEKREFLISHKMILENGEIRFLEEKGKHFYDEKGNHIKSVGCTYNITEKYQSEKLKNKVIKQNKQFKKLFDKFDENVIASTTNLKGIITYTSKAFCEISGYSKNELVGSAQNIVRHPDSSSNVFKELWQTIEKGNVWQGELKNKNKDGSYYWVYAVIYPEYDEKDNVYGYSAIRQNITAQKELEELNKHIKSSIEVASFIQESILPSSSFLDSCFNDKFIIWEPKDIVGGDIYFLEKLRNNDECLLMVIDCTGHGVPGAFVSMLIKAIKKQVIQKQINKINTEISPGEILRDFNRELKEILNQKERNLASNVGFDGGIIYYNKKEKILRFSGAANTLIYYDNNEIKTIKGDRHSIGYKNSDINHEFKNHEINVEKGMKFYLLSDGYIDQIGGKKNQSFSKSRTIEIINKNINKPMIQQKDVLLEELSNYQGDQERIDDVTIVAVEI